MLNNDTDTKKIGKVVLTFAIGCLFNWACGRIKSKRQELATFLQETKT